MSPETSGTRFFVVASTFSRAAFWVEPVEPTESGDPVADFMGQSSPPSFRRFRLLGGRSEPDYVHCSLTPLTLVSDAFVRAMQGADVTGWSTYEVELERSGDWPHKAYFGLQVTGRCGEIDDSKRQVLSRISPYSGAAIKVHRGLHFEEGTWDGSDLFVSSARSTFLFATERVRSAAKKARLKGADFTEADEFELLWPELS